jgi:hypothetical protein
MLKSNRKNQGRNIHVRRGLYFYYLPIFFNDKEINNLKKEWLDYFYCLLAKETLETMRMHIERTTEKHAFLHLCFIYIVSYVKNFHN